MSMTCDRVARGEKGAINYSVYRKTPMQSVNHSLRSITKPNATVGRNTAVWGKHH